ncbi:hypothetical protein SELMODRAFT_410404 [Selaginella moellendorffii]|uniref:Uncharacterized protein n=1 Tax=Selaginella moellendorffii TaxID=88036 RepID=D8REM6_SELML|nr:uncharacterized protein LOC9660656 [Selaginella moellendorffii]XP_024530033.1 uncharacterized protein LOC9660656 [Selaginella moellendorffii]XP_024530035.1 uncharacterized protein LOC9660656 [Selaginella moellendorffii]EFJ29690.1 hypothetical protein SELMODRAFT_410404 [Selaginella moellendorffii]|eukprot:XP_002969602.1 uncharacterized protein LOC9660656 [Selaginella moellendorffii]
MLRVVNTNVFFVPGIALAINPKDFSTKRVFCLVLQPLISRSVVYHLLIALEDKFGSRCPKNKIKITAFDFTTLSCVVYHRPRALEKPDARKPLKNYRNHSVESVDSWGTKEKEIKADAARLSVAMLIKMN